MSIWRWLASAFVTAIVIAGPALAQQDFPNKPIRLIVPNPPGGATDVLARILAEEMTASLGQPVVVDYKAGASGTIGSELVAKSKPDGYTLVMGHAASHATSPSMYRALPYDPIKDFAPVCLVATVTNILVVNPQLPVHSVRELIALAKAKPHQLTFGSGGVGAITHLAGELFAQMADIDIVHVPYSGSAPAITNLLGGHISMMFENMPGVINQVKAGSLRGLAVTGVKRSPAVPDLPTVAEAGVPGYEAVSWFGVLAPAGTPRPIVEKLNHAMVLALKKPDVQVRLEKMGAEGVASTPEEFATLLVNERDKWAKVIHDAHVQAN
ncbi:MAG TPA: tripartite tricarboxylate transporter substrate binding protein [Burkholderiales bacterium]|nr:tripartite tricarboxylate transporter substrate binding protein [Burkholderiales bacterium]